MSHSLNKLYRAIGVSKQAFHQKLDRQMKDHAYEHQLLYLVYEIRKDHPTMACRYMYYKIRPEKIGRDRFEEFCKFHGLSSDRTINYRRTTDSSGVKRFINLTIGLKLNRLNQLWVSDITYFDVGNKTHYLTFIIDAYSRRIIGHQTSARLFTEKTTLPALEMAYQTRKNSGMDVTGTILHSDGGGQFYDAAFLKLTEALVIHNSMCEYPWENGKAERINGIIKNNYLKHRSIKTLEELCKEVDRAVKLYNEEKPHIALKRLSPVNFENHYLANGKTSDGEKSTTEN